MGMPTFPPTNCPKPPSFKILIRRLLETVALEELALAHLVNAEAEKVQEITKCGFSCPLSGEEVFKINESVAKVIEAAEKKEQQLQIKLKTILSIIPNHCDDDDDDDDDDDGHGHGHGHGHDHCGHDKKK